MTAIHSFRQIALATLLCLLGLLAIAPPAHAQLTLSIDQPDQVASPGSTVTFTGTVTNTTGFDLDAATELFVNVFNYDPSIFNPPPEQLLGTPDFTLLDGTTSPDVQLFDIDLASLASPAGSPYLADVTISDIFGDLSNDVTIAINVPVPEPGSLLLLLGALALGIGFGRRGTRLRAFNRLLLRSSWVAGALLFSMGFMGPAQAAVTPVQLLTLNGATSVWNSNPNKVGVELQIGNTGTAAANNVNVTSVAVSGGSFSGPGTLPIALGTIDADSDTMLDMVITVPVTNGSTAYRLTISGTYSYSGVVYGFTLNWAVIPNSAGPGTIASQSGIATIQNPSVVPYPPAPTQPSFEPNAETPDFIPIGPPNTVFPPTPTGTQLGTSAGSPSVQIPVNTTHYNNAGVPPDPNATASGGGVVLATYNTGIAYSVDGGATFTDVNPFAAVPGEPSRTSFFPQSDGGLCCDQIVVYLPKQNIFVWSEQYWPITSGSTITQPDRERIAWATPAAIKANFYDAWTYIDLTANGSSVSSGLGTANNEWVDYPDLAWSSTYLYFDVDHGFPQPGKVYTGQRIVARLSLADMVNPSATVVHYSYALLTGSNGLNKDHAAQMAPGQMVLASLDNSSTLRVFTWNDSDSSITNTTVGITQINQGSNYTSIAPDGSNWVGVSFPGNITGATYRTVFGPQDQYVFAFDAGVNGSGRPRSYVRLETLTPSGSGYSVVAEYDIFNPDYAFAMAGLGTDNSAEIGLTLAVGGGTVGYPQDSVGFMDDFVVYQVTSSNATQTSRFGDYFGAKYIAASNEQFAAEAYDVILNPLPPGVTSGTCATVGCSANMRYVQFGRPPSQGIQ
ncbi:MAG: hypothetical protein WAU56_14395 [Steroidobacteraceae bacterium]